MMPVPESDLDPARVFKAYHIDDDGRVRTFTVIAADTEAEAIEQARALSGAETIELWQRSRLIAYFSKLG